MFLFTVCQWLKKVRRKQEDGDLYFMESADQLPEVLYNRCRLPDIFSLGQPFHVAK